MNIHFNKILYWQDGVSQRIVFVSKDPEEILVAADNFYPLVINGSDRYDKCASIGSIHLHFILIHLTTAILGISAFYHDSAAALLIDGQIVAAAQEERFSRVRHDAGFPTEAIRYVLREGGLNKSDLNAVVFYEKPLLKFERLLETYHSFAPRGVTSFTKAIPVWVSEKLFIKRTIRKHFKTKDGRSPSILFTEHHLSHAASAFYPSPFDEAAILTVDGVGEWATTTICHGSANQIKILRELSFPHSVGLLYSAFTYWLGFKVNSGEYKLMGLAPYGCRESDQVQEFKEKIRAELVDLREDGSILLNMKYFNYATGLTMTRDKLWELLFGFPRRKPESAISQVHANLALAIQQILEEILIGLARTAKKLTSSKNLVMAGGVALNCVANSRILEEKIFEKIWIQPAAGDAGGALGAACAAHHIWFGKVRNKAARDTMNYAYLGPAFTETEIKRSLNRNNASFQYFKNFADITETISRELASGKVVGWFQDRMEFGPRALGNRSILADPRDPGMQKKLNLKIKYREGFRPFAPSILKEDAKEYFEFEDDSPYMLFIAMLNKSARDYPKGESISMDLVERLQQPRSKFPSVTHMDYSARIQTVDKAGNPKFWQLLQAFKGLTGCGMLINTSFNVRGEPIVCSPDDAYQCFMQTEMDWLVIDHFLLNKNDQPSMGLIRRFDPD